MGLDGALGQGHAISFGGAGPLDVTSSGGGKIEEMTDYGRELQFGSFVTPRSDDAAMPVRLAQVSEQVGLDLVTFQDHPYQASFLDTWTLMSFVAAATSTISLAPNVANLPLRPPAVLARSAASLDLLSGGRVELGIGSGAFWEGIEAMGGRRLAPREAVEALAEAIAVIRGIWSSERGGVKVEGQHYRVVGAKRGPAPAHDIGIWVGAYKPRMLELTGRLADGWLPSLGYIEPGEFASSNARIDEACAAAGRSPASVRRLLNIIGGNGPLAGPPSSQWVEVLAGWAIEHGFDTFILGADDPAALQRFAVEVAPAVREAVERERLTPVAAAAPAAPVASPPPGPVAEGAFAVVPTPDDGVRRSASHRWDESSRPVGPAPDAARVYTPAEMASGQHLIDVHDHLRAELRQVTDVMEQVLAGETDPATARSHINATAMRQNNWTLGAFCQSYCRLVTTHHTIEDVAMFPRLRSLEPGLGDVVDRLEDEHRVIHDVLEELDAALVRFVGDPEDHEQLREAVDQLSDTLLSHLSYEERELVEPLSRFGIT
jgi:hypothetical protein